jgi:hypothetical protein
MKLFNVVLEPFLGDSFAAVTANEMMLIQEPYSLSSVY